MFSVIKFIATIATIQSFCSKRALFTIGIFPLELKLFTLLGMSLLGGFSHASLLSFKVAVIDYLKAAHVLLLKGP